ncbi:RNA polymerase sigma factor [Mucilaginibacter sp. X4EP1]|uniref:RNA polymerase sigma factor n=1 Tax=Mucilaginibacter sp. X4EP1 TaxID=2723092 RepID=UPI002167F743|nr:RNA polymerase sigma-70 factor [Mucilaginibacter sp. X4EP1]MCS3811544.1 RNA polymerase sigma-70 factor (ECF subfamily) [Mucilaginibacter sp. X4EP1]
MKPCINHSEEEIIQKLKNDDGNAIDMLYELHWRFLFQFAYNVLKDKETCEDILQELFIRIWQNRQQLVITTSLRSYLKAAVRYEVYRKVRFIKKFEPIVDQMIERIGGITYQENLEYTELQNRINIIVDMLPSKCKDVYRMSRNEQLSHKEIAGKLNISTKTVRNHITHALRHLRVSVNHYMILLTIFLLSL